MCCSSVLRCAVIAEITKQFESKAILLDENRLQKMVFFVQHAKQVTKPFLYEFYFFRNNGPYCIGLDVDIRESILLHAITFKQDSILTGYKYEELTTKNNTFIQEIQQAVDLVVSSFGELSEEKINLYASIVYVDNYIDEFVEEVCSREDFVSLILNEYDSCKKEKIHTAIVDLVKYKFLEGNKYDK